MSIGLYNSQGKYVPLAGREGAIDEQVANTPNMVSSAAILSLLSQTNIVNEFLTDKSIQMVN